MSFAAGWGWASLMHLAIVRTRMETPAEASGITQAGTFTGGTIGPLVFGWAVAAAGYRTAWIGAGIFGLVGAVLLLWERRRGSAMGRARSAAY